MSEQKGLAPAIMVKGAIEDLSGDSETWSGEGTSETLSSSDDKPKVRIPYKMTQARSRLLSRVDTGHEALPTAVPTPISGPPFLTSTIATTSPSRLASSVGGGRR